MRHFKLMQSFFVLSSNKLAKEQKLIIKIFFFKYNLYKFSSPSSLLIMGLEKQTPCIHIKIQIKLE